MDVEYHLAVDLLKPSTAYEVRISYPAFRPVIYMIEWAATATDGDVLHQESRLGRALLNTEKLMFHTDEQGRIPVCTAYELCWRGAGSVVVLVACVLTSSGLLGALVVMVLVCGCVRGWGITELAQRRHSCVDEGGECATT